MGSPPSSNMYLKQGPHGPSTHNSMPNHPGNHQMYSSRGPEAHALVVTLSLSDSIIGLFRDHNFDSCNLCVCNANNKIIGNIRGSEVGIYVHLQDTSPDDEHVRCNCGFSASANRRYTLKTKIQRDTYTLPLTSGCNTVYLFPGWHIALDFFTKMNLRLVQVLMLLTYCIVMNGTRGRKSPSFCWIRSIRIL